jgi:acyl carrier protein
MRAPEGVFHSVEAEGSARRTRPAGGEPVTTAGVANAGEGSLGDQVALETEIKRLIIEALMLEDTSVEDIETDAALFDSGLGLDSIDALEIAIALENSYGVTVEDDPEKNQEIFASVASLARFVSENRSG